MINSKKYNIDSLRESCCGCGSCSLVCTKSAIEMHHDKHGFTYPVVDNSKCVHCGLCVKKCPAAEKIETESINAYYGWNNDINIRRNSSSGGLFSAFADKILESDGAVYGAIFDPIRQETRYESTDVIGIDDLRRSKYVEAYTYDTFLKVKEDLMRNRKVLFCGTPCHIAGLVKYLGKTYNNLFTCDFVCGGVASPEFLKAHINKVQNTENSPIIGLNFRDKRLGWKRMLLTFQFENGRKRSHLSYFDSFFNGFIEGLTRRTNCFSCQFSAAHQSDVTVADYWGYKNAGVPYEKDGISMIIVNTVHGKELFNSIKNNVTVTEMGLEKTRYTVQPRILDKTKYERSRKFFELAEEIGYEDAAKEVYMQHPLRDIIKEYLPFKC